MVSSSSAAFPCREIPVRCIFSNNKRSISVSRRGNVVALPASRQAFFVLPQGRDLVLLQSCNHKYFLRTLSVTAATISVAATKDKNLASLWKLTPTAYGSIQLLSLDHNVMIVPGDEATREVVTSENSIEAWDVEFLTGELCFISNLKTNLQIRCDIAGRLSLTQVAKGWEVWRFIEAGDGKVRISSWMHPNQYLASTNEGDVLTCTMTDHQQQQCNKDLLWYVQKDTSSNGVVIKSFVEHRF
jgi:hypothetical protein